jgi:hypothetical protein
VGEKNFGFTETEKGISAFVQKVYGMRNDFRRYSNFTIKSLQLIILLRVNGKLERKMGDFE